MQSKVKIWTDGACHGNPGIGAVGIILKYKNEIKEIQGYVDYTTNNQMELLAVIIALDNLKYPCIVDLYTDSKYVKDGITTWIAKWKSNGWKNSFKDIIKNKNLWQKLDEFVNRHNVIVHWIKGHNGIEDNERVDFLCQEAIKNLIPIDEKYLHLLK